MRIGNFRVVRRCSQISKEVTYADCWVILKKGKRVVWQHFADDGKLHWLRFGSFKLLPGRRPQLIVETFSGGAHCCSDYYVFDLNGSKHRVIYDSHKFDSANEIGNELRIRDLNGDGIFEFYRSVMAFDYLGQFGHASAVFPPAIFSFSRKRFRYDLATRKFPKFVTQELEREIKNTERWSIENNIGYDETQESLVRSKFLYLVYSGKETEAWPYFLENYRSKDGNGYQEKFRDKFVSEFKVLFKNDPTYQSIYSAH